MTFKDIDTNLRLDKSGAYYVIGSGLYNVAFAAAIGAGKWDVAYEVPRPVKEKFRDPGKARPPVMLTGNMRARCFSGKTRLCRYGKAGI